MEEQNSNEMFNCGQEMIAYNKRKDQKKTISIEEGDDVKK